MSSDLLRSAMHSETPLWVHPVQVRVDRDHLRLQPQTELESASMQLIAECAEAIGKLLRRAIPVTER